MDCKGNCMNLHRVAITQPMEEVYIASSLSEDSQWGLPYLFELLVIVAEMQICDLLVTWQNCR